MGNAHRSVEFVNLHSNSSFLVGSGKEFEGLKSFSTMAKDARPFLFNLKSRSNEGGGGSAVKPTAAASAGFLYEESVQAAGALDSVEVDAIAYLGLPSASGAAAATDLLDATLFQDTGKPAGAATDSLNETFFQGMGKPAAATDLLDAPGSAATVLGDNGGVLNSTCMVTLSAVGAANSFDLTGEESAKGHWETTSVQGDTGSSAFSSMQHTLIRGCQHNSFHHPIHACAHYRLDLRGVGSGVGVGLGACAGASCGVFFFGCG